MISQSVTVPGKKVEKHWSKSIILNLIYMKPKYLVCPHYVTLGSKNKVNVMEITYGQVMIQVWRHFRKWRQLIVKPVFLRILFCVEVQFRNYEVNFLNIFFDQLEYFLNQILKTPLYLTAKTGSDCMELFHWNTDLPCYISGRNGVD